MRWIHHGERTIYTSPWVTVGLADVEVPGGERFDHHVVHAGTAVGTVIVSEQLEVLMLWRHRFITDTWGWEIPAGRVDDDESLDDAARRESLEETGWEVDGVEPLVSFYPSNGLSDQAFHIFVATSARYVGDPSDPSESERVEWLPMERVRSELAAGSMTDGLSLTGCSYALAFHPLFTR